MKKYDYDRSYFHYIDNEQKAYWMGFILADGNVNKYENCMTIRISKKDESHIQKISQLFKVPYKTYQEQDKRTNKVYHGVQFDLSSKQICQDLINKDIKPRKKGKAKQIFSSVPSSLYNHFIRGFFDGDGSISIISHTKNRKIPQYRINMVGKYDILFAIQNIFYKKLKIPKNTVRKMGVIYTLDYGGNRRIRAIGNYMYGNSSLFLERKKERFDNLWRLPARKFNEDFL